MTQHNLDLSVTSDAERSSAWMKAERKFAELTGIKQSAASDEDMPVESMAQSAKLTRSDLVPYVLSENARTNGVKRGKIKKFLPPDSTAQKLGHVLRVFEMASKQPLKLARLREGYVFHAHTLKLPGGSVDTRFVGYTNKELTPRANGKLSVKGFAFLVSKTRAARETVHCIYIFNADIGPRGVRRNLGISDSSPNWTRENSYFHIHPHKGYRGVIAVRDRS